MTIIEFLEARISQDEDHARKLAETDRRPVLSLANTINHPQRLLAECAAKRAIIAQHQSWPVLAEKPTEFSTSDDGLNGISYRASQQMIWLTEHEYVNKFGEEPPTAPMIRTLAAIYADHPDYKTEWEL